MVTSSSLLWRKGGNGVVGMTESLSITDDDLQALVGTKVPPGMDRYETFYDTPCRHRPLHADYAECVIASDQTGACSKGREYYYYQQRWVGLETCPECRKTNFKSIGSVLFSDVRVEGQIASFACATVCPWCRTMLYTYPSIR